MSMIKYRIHEVAKDFNVQGDIADTHGLYRPAEESHASP